MEVGCQRSATGSSAGTRTVFAVFKGKEMRVFSKRCKVTKEIVSEKNMYRNAKEPKCNMWMEQNMEDGIQLKRGLHPRDRVERENS